MGKLTVEQCPETGICSIYKEDGTKVDLMPTEATDILTAMGDTEKIKAAIAEADSSFAEKLDAEELQQIGNDIK